MTPFSILVCDDRTDGAAADAVSEASGIDVASLQGPALTDALTGLFTQVDRFLKSNDRGLEALPTSLFDGHDVVIVDNNLAELEIPGARLTAEAMLGGLRAFASSAYLLSLNKNPQVDFDLRYLIGDYATRADLALNEDHLTNAVFWGATPKGGEFAPWYWPVLADAAQRRREQIEFVEAHLDDSIVRTLGMSEDVVHQLPSRAIGFLDPAATVLEGSDGLSLDVTSFWQHFRSSNRSIPFDDRKAIVFGSAHPTGAGSDLLTTAAADAGPAARRIAARLVAAELDIWFRRDLLGPQELLVDAPHLQVRIGARAADDPNDPSSWDRTCTETDAPFGFDATLYERVIGPNRFQHDIWVPRPAFWLQAIENHPEIAAFRKTGEKDSTLAFAEDTRRFVRTTADPSPWRFVPENGRPWLPRFVERLSGYNYSPSSSFAR